MCHVLIDILRLAKGRFRLLLQMITWGKWVIFMFRWGHQVFLGWWAVCVNFEPDFGKHVSFRLAWLWLLTLNYPGRFIVSLRRYLTLLIPSRSWNVQRLLGLLLLNFGDVNWFVLGPFSTFFVFPVSQGVSAFWSILHRCGGWVKRDLTKNVRIFCGF